MIEMVELKTLFLMWDSMFKEHVNITEGNWMLK